MGAGTAQGLLIRATSASAYRRCDESASGGGPTALAASGWAARPCPLCSQPPAWKESFRVSSR
jgi:hypothetical protein